MAFLRIGHRGASGTRPELTRAAFERAIELGVDMIELDVQLTRDRQLVVLHDLELGRTVAGEGPVRAYSLEELRARDAGSWFDAAHARERVLSLEEVFDLTAGRANLNVEIKSPEPDWTSTASELSALLVRSGRLDTTIVSSFALGALRAVRRVAPRARLGVLWQQPILQPLWAAVVELEAIAVHPLWRLVNEELITAAHSRGLIVLTWTVNDPGEMRRLAALGVDGIISDFPERFEEVGSRQ